MKISPKLELLLGTLGAFISCFFGVFLYITFFTEHEFIEGYKTLKSLDSAGKVITLGAMLNLAAFFVLKKKKKEMAARGMVLGTILITFYTIFL